MKILYIFKSKDAAPSIRRVFEPIAKELSKTNDVESFYVPTERAGLFDMYKNVKALKKELKGKKYDIVHVTGDVYYMLFFLWGYKTVVTVHDLGFYTNYKFSLYLSLRYLLWILPLRLASMITFISTKSMEEALGVIKLRKDKLSVISNPYDNAFCYSPKKINSDNPIILHVGNKPNKNLQRVIQSLIGIHCKLHVIGPLSMEDCTLLDKNKIIYHNDEKVSDEELLKAYKECDLVSFPSLYEGFGMPILEGQAIGRPVVTSNISPMQEVAGGASVLVNPEDVKDIRSGFKYAIENADILIEKGLENVKRFKAEVIASNYLMVYNEILRKSK